MSPLRSVKVPIILSAVLIAAFAGIGWHDHGRLKALRASHAELLARASAAGIDVSKPAPNVRATRSVRADPEAEARRVAADFIRYSGEMAALGDQLRSPDEATRQRIADQMNQVAALSGDQLRILCEEIIQASDLDRNERLGLFRFAIGRLTEDSPRKSLELLLHLPGVMEVMQATNGVTENLIMDAFRSWSRQDPRGAIEWFRKHKGEIPAALIENSGWGLIQGSAVGDPALAFQLIEEAGLDRASSVPQIARAAKTPEERLAVLGALRRSKGGVGDGEVIRLLSFGASHQPEGFERVTAWISKARLSRDEIGMMAQGMERYVQPQEAGRWMEWLGGVLPGDEVEKPVGDLMERWVRQDYRAAGAWLEQLEEGSVREAAARAYEEAVSR